jgi:zinc and cadmium transporter
MPIALLVLPIISTLAGGWLALRSQRYLPLLLAVGTGLLLGTAFLDLLPQALLMARPSGQSPGEVLTIVLAAFLAFLFIERVSDGIGRLKNQRATTRKTLGRVSGGLLIFHSFRDGMVIGAAYSASPAAGLTVAFGIVAHDIGDRMNTMLLSTAGEKPGSWDVAFLIADALAPFMGGLYGGCSRPTMQWFCLPLPQASFCRWLPATFFPSSAPIPVRDGISCR